MTLLQTPASAAPTHENKPFKCWKCGRTLFIDCGFAGKIEIRCQRCKSPNVCQKEPT